ncbi:MAG: hypothetical protein H6936_14320 [Burkholderiales bacterium]|nr:hypothetical protein [Nitrosomonas sp.]MCP5275993.1 hypothetical protein [Burkholderiales bacterium]
MKTLDGSNGWKKKLFAVLNRKILRTRFSNPLKPFYSSLFVRLISRVKRGKSIPEDLRTRSLTVRIKMMESDSGLGQSVVQVAEYLK